MLPTEFSHRLPNRYHIQIDEERFKDGLVQNNLGLRTRRRHVSADRGGGVSTDAFQYARVGFADNAGRKLRNSFMFSAYLSRIVKKCT